MAQIAYSPLDIVLSDDCVQLFVCPGRQYYVDTVLYVRHADGCFPDDSWVDSVNIVLEKWEHTLLSHVGDKTAVYDLPFFDQNCFKMRVKQNGDRLTVEGVDRLNPYGPVTVFTLECTVQDMLRAMLDAYKQYGKIVYTADCFQREPEIQRELLRIISRGRGRIRQALRGCEGTDMKE